MCLSIPHWLAVLLLLLPSLAVSANQPRLALVIGNAAYRHAAPLENTLNDVRDIAKDLKVTGFKVTKVENADLDGLIEAVDGFVARLHEVGGVGLLYYSGHGIQVNGHNYLVPVDARLKRKSRVKYEAYALDDALSRMGGRGAGAVNLVILDACRDNPFAATRGGGAKGLVRVHAPESTLILYATKPGETASDNPEGRNGLFTKHLRQAIRQPGQDVEKAFGEVVKGVYRDSKRDQYPWKEGVLLNQFYFIPSTLSMPGAQPVTLGGTPIQTNRSQSQESVFWQSVTANPSVAGYSAYLEVYPNGGFVSLARARLADLQKQEDKVGLHYYIRRVFFTFPSKVLKKGYVCVKCWWPRWLGPGTKKV